MALYLDGRHLSEDTRESAGGVRRHKNSYGRQHRRPPRDCGAGAWSPEAAVFWLGFLRRLEKRGLKGVKLVISDAHEGLKAAIAQVFNASWQRRRVHFMRNALAHAPRAPHQMVAAAIRSVFAQNTQAEGSKTWRHVADQFLARLPKLAALMDEAEAAVTALMAFPTIPTMQA